MLEEQHNHTMAQDLSLIRDRLYDGVIDPREWYLALEGIRQANEGALFYNFAVDASTFAVVSSMQNEQFPADLIREYEQFHAHQDERMPIVMNMRVGQVMYDHEHFSARQLSSSFIYSDWLPALGYKHTMCMPLHEDGNTREFLSIIRPADHGAYGLENRETVAQLLPDLIRATKLRSRMTNVALHASAGLSAVDSLNQCVAVLDADGLVRFLNKSAQLSLAGGSGFRVRHGRLVAHESKVHAELLEGIRGACGERRRATVLSFTQQGLTALCSVLPLRATHVLSLCLTAAPQALLVWTKPRTLDDAEQLSAALGFSESEARLALVLVTGKTLKDFAKLQGCTMNTARTHLKNLLRKSGCSRQIELVQLLMPLQIC